MNGFETPGAERALLIVLGFDHFSAQGGTLDHFPRERAHVSGKGTFDPVKSCPWAAFTACVANSLRADESPRRKPGDLKKSADCTVGGASRQSAGANENRTALRAPAGKKEIRLLQDKPTTENQSPEQ